MAQERARSQAGSLILRNEDLDRSRCKPEFVNAMFEDLQWFGLRWDEGPDLGGAYGPYTQSERRRFYLEAFEKLKAGGYVYPCTCTRKDVLRSAQAPHAEEEEPIYPGTCRLAFAPGQATASQPVTKAADRAPRANWRFLVPQGETIEFVDSFYGTQKFIAGSDFGDFVVWRADDLPAYQLAVVVDDAAMEITEVVRGADLLTSTARQILIYRALGLPLPSFFHCPLVLDERGKRLAKRHDSLSLRALRCQGKTPGELRSGWSAVPADQGHRTT
jgi:glutamyl-tRNA synthetase